MTGFEKINRGYNSVFQLGKLSIGIVVPIENYASSPVPSMNDHLKRVQLVEKLGFKSIWLRDVPFNVPSFGDAGQTFDPFVYLGFLAAQTSNIALGISSIALPLHHPVHVAKSAATIDQLSDGRMILGVASGDRPVEYPAMNIDFENRGAIFRDAFEYIRSVQTSFPVLKSNQYGQLEGQIDMLPKAIGHKIPILVTGHSRQSIEWIAQKSDGWMYYPRNFEMLKSNIKSLRDSKPENSAFEKPFMQPLYVDFQNNDDFKPEPIHLGFRVGSKYLIEYLHILQEIGVNHIALNFRFNTHEIEKSLEIFAEKVLLNFYK